MKRPLLAAALPAALLCGCAGPNPVQLRVSLFTVYAPRVAVYAAPAATNAAARAESPRAEGDANTLTVAPTQRGTLVMFDNMLAFPNGSGTAASNSVLSSITVPLTP